MPMIRCGLVPARMPRIFASRIASVIALGKRGFIAIQNRQAAQQFGFATLMRGNS